MSAATEKSITIALAGNPNSGKTTVFNNLTGTRQKVGNWPGVTVEKKEGIIHRFGRELVIVDLPGTYSLTPYSIEEIVARDFVLNESPDVVVDIIDASNLERSLYLAVQLREINCKVVFVLNMADLARRRGIKIDAQKLSELLDVPVVFTVGNKKEGMENLLKTAVELAESEAPIVVNRRVRYSADIEDAIGKLQAEIQVCATAAFPYHARWTAIKLLENDDVIRERVLEKLKNGGGRILDTAERLRKQLRDQFNDEPEILLTDERFGFIAGIVKEVLTTTTQQRVDISRNIDLVLTNRFFGFPIFILFIWAMFQLTFTVGDYPKAWIENGVGLLSASLNAVLPDGIFKELLLDGIIAGVGSVVVFLPNILLLFFCIALFEDTGYMARAAFLMDRIMHLIGLHGKSFIPMLMGFGCSVPAIMAARTLESEKDRILTILITPFMSCSARLPIYIVLAGTFFAAKAGTVIFLIYLLGIVMAVVSGRLFRSTLLRGQDAPFVMELPPYRIPMLKSLMIHMWDRGKMFLKKMGGVILIGSIVVWSLSAFPRNIEYSKDYEGETHRISNYYEREISTADPQRQKELLAKLEGELGVLQAEKKSEKSEKSFMGRIGKVIEPAFSPIGIDWRGSIALMTGFVAKEIVVSTLGILYAVESRSSEALQHAIKNSGMTALSALSMMVFVLLYLPCLATVTTIRKETNSFRWTAFSIAYSSGIAWVSAFFVYQGGRLLGLG